MSQKAFTKYERMQLDYVIAIFLTNNELDGGHAQIITQRSTEANVGDLGEGGEVVDGFLH